TATVVIYTLSLHDALPIFGANEPGQPHGAATSRVARGILPPRWMPSMARGLAPGPPRGIRESARGVVVSRRPSGRGGRSRRGRVPSVHEEPLHPGLDFEVQVVGVGLVEVGREHVVEDPLIGGFADDAQELTTPSPLELAAPLTA